MPPEKRGPSQTLRGRSAKSLKVQTSVPDADVRASATATSASRRPVATSSRVTSSPSVTVTHLHSSADRTADAIAAAVISRIEQSGRLLPAAPPLVEQPTNYTSEPSSTPLQQNILQEDDLDASENPGELLDGLLGVEMPTQLPGYSLINRPLGGHLSAVMRRKICAGKFVHLPAVAVRR